MTDNIVDSRALHKPSTLLELRKRAESLAGRMHGGSIMICDARTLLAVLDGLATELESAAEPPFGAWPSDYDKGLACGYTLAAHRLRGLDANL
jgi:hypothetical protein